MEKIDKFKLKITTQTIELEGELDRDKRTYVLAEYEIYEVSSQDNHDGTYNQVYKSKLVGSSEVKQDGKVTKGKSKRSPSQKLKQRFWTLNSDDEFYNAFMDKLIFNLEEVIEFLRNK